MSATLKAEIIAVMQRDDFTLDDVAFNDLAQRVFHFQFEHNEPYRRYCERRAVRPAGINSWLDVPAVPAAAFKEAALVAGDPAHAQAVFRTSGTTRGREKRGQHYVLDLELYERSLLPTFSKFVVQHSRMPIVSLVPQWQPGGESSLSYMIAVAIRELGSHSSGYAIDERGIQADLLLEWLQDLSARKEPLCLVGTSIAFVHWFENLASRRERLLLAAGSRIMDTGGFKGSQRVLSSGQLRQQYRELLGVPTEAAVNEYGMTEMLSQYYDAPAASNHEIRLKQGPPWVRYAIVDPLTLSPLPPGTTGLLRHFDLANLFSVSAIQTEDLARAHSDGFELLGRAAGATPRGCSIAMDMFLNAARS